MGESDRERIVNMKMKEQMRLNRVKLIHSLRLTVSRFRYVLLNSSVTNAVFLRNGGQSLINLFLGIEKMTGLSVNPGRVRAVVYFVRRIHLIARSRGVKGLTLYLKACAVSLQQSLGGHVVPDSFSIAKSRVSRTSTGLPRIIPSLHRDRIRAGDVKIIRIYLSFFNAYRVLTYPGRLKLQSITDPFNGTAAIDLDRYIPIFVKLVELITKKSDTFYLEWVTERYNNIKLFNIFKSSSSTNRIFGSEFSTHPLAVVAGARAMYQAKKLFKACSGLFGLIKPAVTRALVWFGENIPDHVNMNPRLLYVAQGKLAPKFETAGKIRIFAMVDCWTNWFTKPLHDMLFKLILPQIPQDGTFDQMRPVWRLLKSRRYSGLFSLDLSAATDRLPVELQRKLLAEMLTPEIATAWKGLMVERAFAMTAKGLPQVEGLRYAVGQPMGALSSWAMLALTHHFIVQCASWRSGQCKLGTWYQNYAVLGDDLVIGDQDVVVQYLKILKSLGVECGLAKSLLSPKGDCLEFAKRTVFRGQDVSPIPFKEVAAASLSIPASLDLANKYSLSMAGLLAAYGYGFRVLGSLSKPIGKLNNKVRKLILQQFASKLTVQTFYDFMNIGKPTNPREVGRLFNNTDTEVRRAFVDVELKPVLTRLEALVGELHPKMQTRALTTKYSGELYGYYTGSGAALPDSKMMKLHMQNVIDHTQVVPINDAKQSIMDLLTRVRFLIGANKMELSFLSFADVYFDALYIMEDIAIIPLNNVRFERTSEAEVLRDSRVPYHIRMWMKWSPFVQGTKDVRSLDKETQ